MLNAHPNIIIAHEYNVFLKSINTVLRGGRGPLALFNRNIYDNAMKGWRSGKKGYNLSMDWHMWQGRVRSLRVIGDKGAAMAARPVIPPSVATLSSRRRS